MQVNFRKAVIPKEISKLRAFDRGVFPEADLFTKDEWMEYETYWMTVDRRTVGCCAFQRNVDFQEDLREDGHNPPQKGTLYIVTTGILERCQNSGLGKLLKTWEITYAKYHGFNRILTNCRKRNSRIIGLNRSLGFRVIRETEGYYTGPTDATIVMELEL
jgi:ribosomal protein S18 acetylase RimI-like enzyme